MKINSTEIKNLEPINTIAVPHVGDYSGIGEAFEKLAAWTEANNLWAASPRMLGAYLDSPVDVPVEKRRSKACLEDVSGVEPGEGMERYRISGGKYFVMQVEVTMSEYQDAWMEAETTFIDKGYEFDARDHYELYVCCAGDMQDPNTPWIVDICIPMK